MIAQDTSGGRRRSRESHRLPRFRLGLCTAAVAYAALTAACGCGGTAYVQRTRHGNTAGRGPILLSEQDGRAVESAVSAARDASDPGVRAAAVARAAALYRDHDIRRARQLAAEAVECLGQMGRGEPPTPEALSPDLRRYEVVYNLSKLNGPLSLKVASTIEASQLREHAFAMIAFHCRDADPKSATSARQSITDDTCLLVALVGSSTAHGLKIRMSSVRDLSDVHAGLVLARGIEDLRTRAVFLAFFGALARRLGGPGEWEATIRAELVDTLQEIPDREARLWALDDCLVLVAGGDAEMTAELADRAMQDIEAWGIPESEKAFWRARIMAFTDLGSAMELAQAQPGLLARALILGTILANLDLAKSDEAARACETATATVRQIMASDSPTMRQRTRGMLAEGLLRSIATLRPEEALEIAGDVDQRHGGSAVLPRVLDAVAVAHPELAVARAEDIDDPAARASIMLRAVETRVGESAWADVL